MYFVRASEHEAWGWNVCLHFKRKKMFEEERTRAPLILLTDRCRWPLSTPPPHYYTEPSARSVRAERSLLMINLKWIWWSTVGEFTSSFIGFGCAEVTDAAWSQVEVEEVWKVCQVTLSQDFKSHPLPELLSNDKLQFSQSECWGSLTQSSLHCKK